MTGVAVVGCGYWGPNLIRNFGAFDDCALRMIADPDPVRLAAAARRLPGVRAVSDFQEVLAAGDIEAVSLCTPLRTHYELATAALRAGKHVLVEKPLTHSVETAEALVELAERCGRVLMVDHTFVYAGAVQKIRDILGGSDAGDLLYVDAVRVNLGLFQSDASVVWDLAPHDLSILLDLVGRRPRWVSAIGGAHYGRFENLAYLTLQFDDSLIAHLHVNWLAPVKLRRMLIGGTRKMIVYDDLEPSEKVRVYDKGVTLAKESAQRERALVDYRVGDMWAPYIDKTEPLRNVCREFLDAIQCGVRPRSGGEAGLQVVRILEAAEQSIGKQGERIALLP
jgi:predicted dehydrogenase